MCRTPLQSLSPPPRCPTTWPGLTSLESFDLFNGILARAPCGRLVHVRPVPLSGFLNLSAVSWQARVPRPCFVPQPFLGSPLQSLPLAGIASPLSGSLASLRSSTGVPRVPKSRRSPLGFRRRLRPRAVADFPLGSRSSFQTPAWGILPDRLERRPMGRPFRWLHPLRSLPPPANPLRRARREATPAPVALLGFVPSRVPRSSLGPSTRARPCGRERHAHPKAPARDPEDQQPSEPGGT